MQRHHLSILHHDGAEELRDLPEGSWDVGRGEGCWLAPLDLSLSRRHATLEVEDGAVFLVAHPSRNGTRVNGAPLEGRRRLAAGDEVLVGRTLVTLGSGDAEIERRRRQRTVELGRGEGEPAVVAASPAMKRLLEQAARLARSPLPLLVTGETGVGKELVAAFVHARSPRAAGPFVVLNCPALSPGLVESELFGVEAAVATGVAAREGVLARADGGTLFLDEVGDLPLEIQPKLLRFLQDRTLQRVGGRKPVTLDVRIVAATNQDLLAAVESGQFRRDLYFRLSGARLVVPPLRERPEDVVALAGLALERAATGRRLGDEARWALLAHPFPGNVRELLLMVERAAHLAEGEEITAAGLGLPWGPDGAAELPPAAGGGAEAAGRALLDAVVAGRADLWTDVYEPFRRRELARPAVRAFVAAGLERTDGTVLDLARLLRADDRYRKLLDFLRNNDLLP